MAKLPGTAMPVSVQKTDIIRHHIIAAIQLMAIEANPYSTHLIVMAAEEMTRQVATAKRVVLSADYRLYVKDEYQKEYLNKVRQAYNWFKHADRDANSTYDGPSTSALRRVNEVQTLMNIRSLAEIGGSSEPIFAHYSIFLLMKYPQFMKKNIIQGHAELERQYASLSRDPKVLSLVLRQIATDAGLLPPK